MIELKNSGLPLYLDEENHVMALSALLTYGGFGRKPAAKMQGLLADERELPLEENIYDVYRKIAFPEDEELLKKNDFCYDITIIMPGQINEECKKTSGHYHGWNPEHTNTYGEVYEVIKGTALYILQRSDNFDAENPEDVKVDDLILATVHEGETIIVPPNYGHCSVNIGEGPLVFSNLAYVPCTVNYGPVKHFHGMSCYVFKENGEIRIKLNDRYHHIPEMKFATVKENPALGIKFGLPVYESYKKNPEAFRFLGYPDNYVDEIMSMLVYHDELVTK